MKAILFDLDGTLLPMDQDVFTNTYFKELCVKAAPRGYDSKALIAAVWKGTGAMVRNDGGRSNEEVFWETFCGIFGEKALEDKALFDAFYANEFSVAKSVCGFQPMAAELVHALKDAGYTVVLASNPLFPEIAQHRRVQWAGLDPSDFSLITTYENSHYCKPNPAYYREIADAIGVAPEECLMIGNDAGEDLTAAQTGMQVFLLTDCLINRDGLDISACPQGDYPALRRFLEPYLGKDS